MHTGSPSHGLESYQVS